MKIKKKNIYVYLLILFTLSIFLICYLYYQANLEKKDIINSQDEKIPSSYCLIKYEISSDNGESWSEKIVDDGKKITDKSKCWEEYMKILGNFEPNVNKEGEWIGKAEGDKLILKPSLKISSSPFI